MGRGIGLTVLRRAGLLLAIMFGAGAIGAVLHDWSLATRLEHAQDRAIELTQTLEALRPYCVLPDRTGHQDERDLVRAAAAERIPPLVLLGVAAVESGYAGRYDMRGRVGEFGRMQIRYELWRDHSPDCASADPESQRRCGAQILRACFARFGNWRSAAACYNHWSRPDTTGRYLAGVERELGRMLLRSLEP